MHFLLILVIGFFGVEKTAFAGLPASIDGNDLPTLAPMLEVVTPSVVNIATSGTVVQQSPLFNDPFFRRYFDVSGQIGNVYVQITGLSRSFVTFE